MDTYLARLAGSLGLKRTATSDAEKERQQLEALISGMADAVLVLDPRGSIMVHNQPAASLLGGETSLYRQPVKRCLSLLDSASNPVSLNVKRVASTQERKDLRLKAPDGSYASVSLRIAPYVVDRQNRGYVLVIKDVTQDKTIDREREEFTSVAAHELRTPLTIAQGNISMMLLPPLLPADPAAVSLLNGAQRSLSQLSHIIGDLTNLARADTRQLDVALEPLNPLTLLRELETDYSDQAKGKGLTLGIKVDPRVNLRAILTSDYVVRQILTIFISNAIKFTDEGSVTIAVENLRDRPQGVTFSVSDTGIGIAQSDKKKIFEKFFQSEDYMTRVHGGTGLGLFIAKKLADRLTGEVWFDTELAKGSKFYLWVPPYSRDKDDQQQVASAETKDLFSTV